MELSSNFGDRFAGSISEHKAANWLTSQYEQLGFTVKQYEFTFVHNGKTLKSSNIAVELTGTSAETLVIGAHYDSISHPNGSTGFLDNASGTISLLGLAKKLKEKKHHYTILLVSFGAEEVGLHGSKHYVSSSEVDKSNLVGMINLDTVIGGDLLYIHSAHSTPYTCKDINDVKYTSNSWLRDALLLQSKKLDSVNIYKMHPANNSYPQGETADWSDHAPFSCIGLPIAYIEATNFSIDGEAGYDGYSQTINPRFWSCIDNEKKTACNKSKEAYWGKIWHTKFDQKKYFIPKLEDHIKSQFESNIELLSQFILNHNAK